MSLLDTLASSFGGQSQPGAGSGNASGLIAAAMEFVNNQPGGLNGLIQRFHENGAGDVVSSWIGTGENKPISPDTLTSVLCFGLRGVQGPVCGPRGPEVASPPLLLPLAGIREACAATNTSARRTR